MAHKKGAGSTKNGRDSNAKRLGVKKFGGEFLFTSENANGFIPLVGNSLVIVKAPLSHKVTPVMNSIIPRKTIQIFINKDKKNGKQDS